MVNLDKLPADTAATFLTTARLTLWYPSNKNTEKSHQAEYDGRHER